MAIKYKVNQYDIQDKAPDCMVIGIYSDKNALTSSAEKLDKHSQGYLKKRLASGDINTELGQHTLLFDIPQWANKRILVMGCGKKAEMTRYRYQKLLTAASSALLATKTKKALCYLSEINIEHHDEAWKVKQIILAIEHNAYRFNEFKAETKKPKATLSELHFVSKDNKTLQKEIKLTLATSHGMALCKDLGNTPSNVCTPSYLAKQAQQLSKQYTTIKTTVLNEAKMRKLGMHSLLAVGAGSAEESRLISLEYIGTKKKDKPTVLVGKGITYDSGGINLKLSWQAEMRYDMCGAATVLGMLQAIAEAKLPINVVGVIAAAENMPSGTALKPSDIITSMSGKTIEILNTDAEGRLVLCDALTYIERFKPKAVIDIATLTGAILTTFGHNTTGLMANHQPLADALLTAGKESNDLAWQLPLTEDYQDLLKSNYADLPNLGPAGQAGSIIAACFLARFAEKYHWAHLDIAGTGFLPKQGATGRPIPLLMQYLLDEMKKA